MFLDSESKYIVVTRHDCETRNSEVNDHTFERVTNFKYLGVDDINEGAESHEEIRLRFIAANKRYFGLVVPFFQIKVTIVENENNSVQSPGETGGTVRLWCMGNNKDGSKSPWYIRTKGYLGQNETIKGISNTEQTGKWNNRTEKQI